MVRNGITVMLAVVLACAGCGQNLSLYNPDGSINRINQVDMIERDYIKTCAYLNNGEVSQAYNKMVKLKHLVELLPEIPSNEKWQKAKTSALESLVKLDSAFKIGDRFAARKYARQASMGINMIIMMAPTFFDEQGQLRKPEDMPEAEQEKDGSLLQPTRPPGLYDE